MLQCPLCQTENRAGRKYCGECGAPLQVQCKNCESLNEPDEKFCGDCGKSLTEQQEELATPAREPTPDYPSIGERRQITIMFADVSGYTRLLEQLDSEELHNIVGRILKAVDRAVADYGGSVHRHVGDEVMALFGAPVAHSDDPFRAILAANKAHQALTDLSSEINRDIAIHIGIASGTVIIAGHGENGNDAESAIEITGIAANLGSRLNGVATARETVISNDVFKAVERQVECENLGKIKVKGISDPITAWRVLGMRSDMSAVTRPIYGRRSELAQFEGVLSACKRDNAGQTVLLRGEAGIGKSRLADEFRAMAETHGLTCHKAQVLDFGTATDDDAVSMLVRNILGIGAKFDNAAAVDSAIADGIVSEEQRVFLNDFVGLPQSERLAAVLEAMENATRDDRRAAVVEALVVSAAKNQPCLIIFEDVHWADGGTLGYLSRIARSATNHKVLLVITTRVEGDPMGHAWRAKAGQPSLMTIDLGPIRETDAFEFAKFVGDGNDAFYQTCVKRAGGNPLFLEQLIIGVEKNPDSDVPGTVKSIITARLDSLSDSDKLALQTASAIGQRFSLPPLRNILGDQDYNCEGLLDALLIRHEDSDLMFAHALIRDAVYDSLLNKTRTELHCRLAAWFKEDAPLLHAEHLDRADDPAAPRAYLDAAINEKARYRFEKGIELVERGAAIAQTPKDQFALLSFHGDLLQELGIFGQSITAFRQALANSADDGERCRALIGAGQGLLRTDQHVAAKKSLETAEKLAHTHDLTHELAQICRFLATIAFAQGDAEKSLQLAQRVVQLARDCQSPELEAQAWSTLADAEQACGRHQDAMTAYQQCVDISRAHRLRRIEAVNLKMQADILVYVNEFEAALEDYGTVIDAAMELGDGRAEFLARGAAGIVCTYMGRLDEAQDHLLRAREIITKMDARRFMVNNNINLANLAVERGDHESARDYLNAAEDESDSLGFSWMKPWLLGTKTKVARDDEERLGAITEAKALFAAGEANYCRFEFYETALEGSIVAKDWNSVDQLAEDFEEYFGPEPLDGVRFLVERGRVLASIGRGKDDGETLSTLHRLAIEAKRVGRLSSLPLLESALTSE